MHKIFWGKFRYVFFIIKPWLIRSIQIYFQILNFFPISQHNNHVYSNTLAIGLTYSVFKNIFVNIYRLLRKPCFYCWFHFFVIMKVFAEKGWKPLVKVDAKPKFHHRRLRFDLTCHHLLLHHETKT